MNNAFYRRFNRMSSKPERSSIEMIIDPFLPSCIQEDILHFNIYANNICNFSNPSCSIMLFEKKHCVRFNKFTLRPPKEKFGFFLGLVLDCLSARFVYWQFQVHSFSAAVHAG